jgi:undecaprenyl-diphosphatase
MTTRVLVLGMISSLAAAALVLLGVVTGATDAIDLKIFAGVHRLNAGSEVVSPGWATEAVRDISALGSFAVLTCAVVLVAACLLALRRYHLATVLIASAILATVISTLLKLVMDRKRPSLVEHAVITYTQSFPSGHALLTAAIILPMAVLLSRTVAVPAARLTMIISGLIITFMVGLSRIYLGVHWPTDVLAGWCIGIFWACATLLAVHSIR